MALVVGSCDRHVNVTKCRQIGSHPKLRGALSAETDNRHLAESAYQAGRQVCVVAQGAAQICAIEPSAQCLKWVCAVTRRRFPEGASPTRQPLQPEATGAAMELTR
jgi:hypothetical protein